MKPRPGQGLVEVHAAKAGTPSFAVMLEAIAHKATRQAAKAHISAGRLAKASKS